MAIARFEKVSKEQFSKDLKDLLNMEDDFYDGIVLPKRATTGSDMILLVLSILRLNQVKCLRYQVVYVVILKKDMY